MVAWILTIRALTSVVDSQVVPTTGEKDTHVLLNAWLRVLSKYVLLYYRCGGIVLLCDLLDDLLEDVLGHGRCSVAGCDGLMSGIRDARRFAIITRLGVHQQWVSR